VIASRVDAQSSTVRRQFDSRAARFARHDAIVRVVGERLVERLELVRHDPRRILDLGCGSGACRAPLLKRFPKAQWIGADLSARMLGAGTRPGWRARLQGALRAGASGLRLCASAERLPLADASIDLVFSNLMLHWVPAPHEAIGEIARVLRPGALVLFSSYGPDTWQELRAASERCLARAQPMPYVDMHDLGDMLVAAGFEAPVMEVEHLHLEFADARSLLREARVLGGNPRTDRARSLPSGSRARALLRDLEGQADARGRIPLHFEIVFGHGWRVPPRVPGVATIAPPRSLRG
jgi:malonyl-CoA O-methyltransferase